MTDDEDAPAPAAPADKPVRVSTSRKAVVNRLWRAARRQLDAHEAHLDGLPDGAVASESDAKALATLARTVRELVALDASTTTRESKTTDESDPAEGLRYAAELRKELARRLDALAERELAKADPGNSAGALG